MAHAYHEDNSRAIRYSDSSSPDGATIRAIVNVLNAYGAYYGNLQSRLAQRHEALLLSDT